MLQKRKKLYPDSPRNTGEHNVERPPSQYMKYGYRFSFCVHAILVFCFMGKWVIDNYWPTPELDKHRLPKKSIRVDIVGLPDIKLHDLYKVDLTKEAQPTPPPVAKEEKKETPPPPPEASKDAMVLPGKDAPKAEPSAKQRLAELQKSIRAEARRQEVLAKFKKDVEKTDDDGDKRPQLGGNIISKGGSVQGDIANEADEFTALIQTHVRKFWRAPPWAAGQNYKTRLLVKLSPTGRVLSKQVIKSSGRSEFDASALEAVEAASPFPPAPEFLKRIVLQEGIECGFPD